MTTYPSRWIPTPDGRRLHAVTREVDDSPATVVLEAGAAASRLSWSRVQPLLAATSVAYDRSGLGRSAPDPTGRTIDRMADDLVTVIESCPPGPVVLVGHSAGGPLVRVAAARTQREVTGLVLVDPTDEGIKEMFTERFLRGERRTIRLALVLAHLRVLPLLFRGHIGAMPPDAARDLRAEGFRPEVFRAYRESSRTFLPTVAGFVQDPPDRLGVPVTIVSGGLPGEGLSERARRSANAAHAARAEHLGGRHVVAEGSTHDVPLTDADLLAEEIHRLLPRS